MKLKSTKDIWVLKETTRFQGNFCSVTVKRGTIIKILKKDRYGDVIGEIKRGITIQLEPSQLRKMRILELLAYQAIA